MFRSIFALPLFIVGLFWLTSLYALSLRFELARTVQKVSCLPAVWFLIDKWGREDARGSLAYFEFDRQLYPFEKGSMVVKRLAGRPGDDIEISRYETSVNGELLNIQPMTAVMEVLGWDDSEAKNSYTLNDGQYFMVGETQASYDSRFWGVVKEEQIKGAAYAVL